MAASGKEAFRHGGLRHGGPSAGQKQKEPSALLTKSASMTPSSLTKSDGQEPECCERMDAQEQPS